MSLITKLASKMLGLPPAVTSKLEYQIDLPVPMTDGTVLLANRTAPKNGEGLPIILIRNPYSPRGDKPDFLSLLIAERGYQVIMQNCRGTWGSGGEFQPFRDEREDGLATFKWLEDQPWFSGSVGMFGLSYFGYVQLASGYGAPDYVKALAPQMSASKIYGVFRSQGTFSFDVTLTWVYQTFVQNVQKSASDKRKAKARLDSALRVGYKYLPVGDVDKVSLNFTSPFFQNIIKNDKPEDDFWAEMDHSKMIGQIKAPVHFIGGWYDFFLADQLADYTSLKNVGKDPYITIGPWSHFSNPGLSAGLKESFIWYDIYLRGNSSVRRLLPVRVCIMGINKWVDLPSWPPTADETRWYLQTGGGLSKNISVNETGSSCYRYNPDDPTPSIGGRVFLNGGPKDNSKIEARSDVITFTSEAMTLDTTIMGVVSVELYVRSSAVYTDFYARLCDVSPNGKKSINICEGIVQLTTEPENTDMDGVRKIVIDLFSTAHCFKTSHRIRLQVSSGAHPAYARNLGIGDSIATGTEMRVADQEIFHNASHPSAVILPAVSTPK